MCLLVLLGLASVYAPFSVCVGNDRQGHSGLRQNISIMYYKMMRADRPGWSKVERVRTITSYTCLDTYIVRSRLWVRI